MRQRCMVISLHNAFPQFARQCENGYGLGHIIPPFRAAGSVVVSGRFGCFQHRLSLHYTACLGRKGNGTVDVYDASAGCDENTPAILATREMTKN